MNIRRKTALHLEPVLEVCQVVDEPLEGVHLILTHNPVEMEQFLQEATKRKVLPLFLFLQCRACFTCGVTVR
jgi:hypothetical protein